MTRSTVFISIVCLLAATRGHSAPLVGSVVALDKRTGCSLSVPSSWTSKTLSWNGPCQNKRANGNGVAKLYANGKMIATWYGDVRSGNMEYGALEKAGTIQHGKMSGGAFVDSDTLWKENKEPGIDAVSQAMNKAMQRGSLAAQTYADQLAKTGNKASAAYYRKKAEKIDLLQGE
jgi:hypothetical protein